jgi:integrase
MVSKQHEGSHEARSGSLVEAVCSIAPEIPRPIVVRIARAVVRYQQEALLRELSGFQPLLAGLNAQAVQGDSKLSDLVKLYAAEHVSRGRWTPRTEVQFRGYLSLMTELLGDPAIGDISKASLRELGRSIAVLPSNLSKRLPGVTATEAIAALSGLPEIPRLAPNSVNAHYQCMRSFFSWAVENDFIERNPASALRDVKVGRASEERLPLNDEDIVAYFATLDAKKGLQPFERWVPRILAYTGCRLGEAVQLTKADFKQVQGVWVVDINDDTAAKRLKTSSSRRLVPLHPRLVELGLLDHVATRPTGFLWPEQVRVAASPARSNVDKIQKRLAYAFRKAGISDPRKTAAHSFRHTVSQRLKSLRVEDYVIAELLGHEHGHISVGRYGGRSDLPMLHSVLARLRLPL